MISRVPSAGAGPSQALWPVLLLVLVACLVPTACVLWFMAQAMRNERLAVQQKLTAVYQNQLAAISRRVDAFWKDKQAALAATDPGAPAGEIFVNLIRSGVVDSVIVYDTSGRLRYPSLPQAPSSDQPAESAQWRGAQELEFERGDNAAAAAAYGRIAQEAADVGLAARALQAQARCLVKAGQQPAALAILTGTLAGAEYRHATDAQGHLIVANAQLLALELLKGSEKMGLAPSGIGKDLGNSATREVPVPIFSRAQGDPAAAESQPVLALLVQLLTDYGDSSLPSGQRRLLMEQVSALVPDGSRFPTLEAEALAAAYLDASPPLPVGSGLVPAGRPAVWQLASPDRTVVALLREERVRRDMQELIDTELVIPDAAVVLTPPGTELSESNHAPFLTTASETFLPGWQLALSPKGPDPFASAADRRIAVHLWTGVLMIVAFGTLAGLVTRYVGGQIRLTRLKNDLLATVSHELKTPLSSIRALVETLLEGRCQDSQQRQEYLQLIAKENERLSRLIDNFLAFSRLERNRPFWQFAEVDLSAVIEAALATEREKFAAAGCQLDVELAPGLPAVVGDADALTTVLINLLDNAYKYTGKDKQVLLRAHSSSGTVCIEVQDNGIGLSRRAARRVFDRFYQADQSLARRAGGCGLGLSIVRLIVQAHGGTVSVESQPGQGSTFKVTLPAGGPQAPKHQHA